MSDYFFSKVLDLGFDETIELVVGRLKDSGFGVLTEIDVAATLKKKIDVDFKKYRILGACNPNFAYEALSVEDNIGVMLPCNVVVKDAGDGKTEVVAVDPLASMQAIKNDKLGDTATQVAGLLKKLVDDL